MPAHIKERNAEGYNEMLALKGINGFGLKIYQEKYLQKESALDRAGRRNT